QIELLKAGAARATSVELTPTYEEVAGELLNEAGLADRVERKVMDFAEAASQVDGADIVILNRVICCYPDMPRLAGAAADHARQVLVLSYPRRTWWAGIGLGLANLMLLAARRAFRVLLHPPLRLTAPSQRHGIRPPLTQA